MAPPCAAERLQKVLSQLGPGFAARSRGLDPCRPTDGQWQAGGAGHACGRRRPAQTRWQDHSVASSPAGLPVFLCHRSPGEPLLPARSRRQRARECQRQRSRGRQRQRQPFGATAAARWPTIHQHQPDAYGRWRAGVADSDGATAERLQRAVHGWRWNSVCACAANCRPMQQQGIREGALDSGTTLRVLELEASGGRRQQSLVSAGRAGRQRQRDSPAGRTPGSDAGDACCARAWARWSCPARLARSHFRELTDEELAALKL